MNYRFNNKILTMGDRSFAQLNKAFGKKINKDSQADGVSLLVYSKAEVAKKVSYI